MHVFSSSLQGAGSGDRAQSGCEQAGRDDATVNDDVGPLY
jgi:hypothetical protein